jgi:hypothetical protein
MTLNVSAGPKNMLHCRCENNVPKKFHGRVARWYIFKPNIPIGVNFVGSFNVRFWYILWPLGYLTAFRHCLWPFGEFYGHLVFFSHFGMFGPIKIWQPWRADKIEILLTIANQPEIAFVQSG